MSNIIINIIQPLSPYHRSHYNHHVTILPSANPATTIIVIFFIILIATTIFFITSLPSLYNGPHLYTPRHGHHFHQASRTNLRYDLRHHHRHFNIIRLHHHWIDTSQAPSTLPSLLPTPTEKHHSPIEADVPSTFTFRFRRVLPFICF